MKRFTTATTAICISSFTLFNTANATEGGGSIYPVGAENYVCCALPPPGFYGVVWGQHYTADKVRSNDGQVVTPPTFKVTANAIVPRFVWVTPYEPFGASLALHTIIPLVDLDVNITPGVSDSKSGIGDITLGAALGWHHSDQLHTLLAFDLFAPTGQYNRDDIANIGRNHWAAQWVAGVSFIDPTGLNADVKAMYTYNLENSATDYTSGQELIIDYDIGLGLGNGWTFGVGGYAYQQVSDDKQAGQAVSDNRGRSLAIGPSVKYDSGKGWFVTGKYQIETHVKNRADGEAFWIKTVFPF
jgi:hypothetical protein